MSFKRLATMAMVGVLSTGLAYGDPSTGAQTKGLMHTILGPLAEVLPLSFQGKAFSDPKNRKRVTELLRQLADNADNFEAHGRDKNLGFEFLAKSLANDTRELYKWYRKGWFNEAKFTLHHITDNCIACHSKLPARENYPGADVFAKKMKVDTLPPLERSYFYVVTRQFDKAMDSYEKVFALSDIHPSIIVVMDAFADYLKIALNVKGDAKRPIPVLESLKRRSDTPEHVRMRLNVWIAALQDLNKTGVLKKKAQLKRGKELIERGNKVMDFGKDRDGLVHYLAAASVLQRFVDDRPRRGKDVAEAYYWLGVTESLLGQSFWVSQMDFYLESAVRLAPETSHAKKAFALLEESLVVGFTGSAGQHVPEDVEQLLSELRELLRKKGGVKI